MGNLLHWRGNCLPVNLLDEALVMTDFLHLHVLTIYMYR